MQKKVFSFWFLIGISLLIPACSFLQSNTPALPEPTLAPLPTPALPAIYQSMRGVVQGQGVPEAATFDPSRAAPHRLVILNPDGEPHEWNDHVCFPYEWQPSSVSEVELVVVVSPQREVELDKQSYLGGPPITRVRFERDVEIRQAGTGEVLWKTTIQGSEPPPFPDVAPKEQKRLEGSETTFLEVSHYLRETLCTAPTQCPSLYPVIENEVPWFFVVPSPDGSIVALQPQNDHTVIQLWHPLEKVQLGELKHTAAIDWFMFSEDGQYLAAITEERKTIIWRMSDKKTQLSLDNDYLIFSPDSRLLAVENQIGQIKIWQLADQTLLQTLQPVSTTVDMAFSPDGQYLAAVSDHHLILWLVSDGKRILLREFNEGLFRSVAFSPDSRILASLATGEVRFWQVENGKLIDTVALEKGGGLFKRVEFSSDGRYFALMAYQEEWLQMWRFADKSPLYEIEGVRSFEFSPQGEYLVTDELIDKSTKLTIRRVQDGALVRTLLLNDVLIFRWDDFGFIHIDSISDGLHKKIMVCPGNLQEKAAHR